MFLCEINPIANINGSIRFSCARLKMPFGTGLCWFLLWKKGFWGVGFSGRFAGKRSERSRFTSPVCGKKQFGGVVFGFVLGKEQVRGVDFLVRFGEKTSEGICFVVRLEKTS